MTWLFILTLAIAFIALARPMPVLSANVEIDRFVDQELREFPVAAAVYIYKGALVGLHPVTGYLKPFEGGDIFVGIAYEEMDNSSGAAGAVNCQVYTEGDFELTVTGVSIADSGREVYAVADDAVSLVGHPDGFVGHIVHYFGTNLAVVRLRKMYETPNRGGADCLEFIYRAGGVGVTGAVAGNQPLADFQAVSALGLGSTIDQAGAIQLAFDGVAEIAQASIETPVALSITKGITLQARLHMTDSGDNAALDVDWGIANVLDGTTRADMDDASLTRHARFHMNGNSDNILAESDDNTSDVTATDTTIDNDTTAGAVKEFVLIARPDGSVEFWIDGSQVLSSTTFGVGSAAGLFAAFINLEKTNNDTTAELICHYLRVAGSRAA